MPEAPNLNLTEFLKVEAPFKHCWCDDAPKAVVDQVNEVIKSGSTQWRAIARWLETQPDTPRVSCYMLARHRDQGHADR